MSELRMTLEGSSQDIQKMITLLIEYSDLTVRYVIGHPQERKNNQVELIIKKMKGGQRSKVLASKLF